MMGPLKSIFLAEEKERRGVAKNVSCAEDRFG